MRDMPVSWINDSNHYCGSDVYQLMIKCRWVTRGESQSERWHRVTQVPVGDVFIMADTLVALQQRAQRIRGPRIHREGCVENSAF